MKTNNTAKENYDVIIIGAGFAGLTAARELRRMGNTALILEARDRLGGRTWTENRLGAQLEIGGTWVHPIQPNVWSEITRYGLELISSPAQKHAHWIADGQLKSGSIEEFGKLIDNAYNRILEDSRVHFYNPFDPLSSESIEEIDKQSITDRLNSLNLTKEEYDIMHGMWATSFHAPPEEGGLSSALRWGALSWGSWQLMLEMLCVYKLKNGTRALIEAIAADAAAEIQLSTIVTAIEKTDDGVTVYTNDGQQFQGKAVIVTVPLNVLKSIEFTPPLSEDKMIVAKEGQASRGVKVIARIRGEFEPFMASAPGNYPLVYAQLEYLVEGDSIVVAFGPDATRLDANDVSAVNSAFRQWLPDVEVVSSTGHDWVADEFSQGTWYMSRPNQFRYLAELQRPENGVFLAGSDYASGWAGFIDGAIESGMIVSRDVNKYITDDTQISDVVSTHK